MTDMGFAEGMFVGFGRSRAAVARGDELMVFDWDKAASLIRERKPAVVEAGLSGDWSYTGGTIYRGGETCDEYTYLASMWAKPMIELDGERVECFIYDTPETNPQGWGSDTQWPESALEILKGEAA